MQIYFSVPTFSGKCYNSLSQPKPVNEDIENAKKLKRSLLKEMRENLSNPENGVTVKANTINKIAITLFNHPEIDTKGFTEVALEHIPQDATPREKNRYATELARLIKYANLRDEQKAKVQEIIDSLASGQTVVYIGKFQPTTTNMLGQYVSPSEAACTKVSKQQTDGTDCIIDLL